MDQDGEIILQSGIDFTPLLKSGFLNYDHQYREIAGARLPIIVGYPTKAEIRDKGLKILDQLFVEGGFAEVTGERCTVFAEESTPVRDITRDDAEERVKRAHDALLVSETFGTRLLAERDLKRAEAMLAAVEQYEKLQGKAG